MSTEKTSQLPYTMTYQQPEHVNKLNTVVGVTGKGMRQSKLEVCAVEFLPQSNIKSCLWLRHKLVTAVFLPL